MHFAIVSNDLFRTQFVSDAVCRKHEFTLNFAMAVRTFPGSDSFICRRFWSSLRKVGGYTVRDRNNAWRGTFGFPPGGHQMTLVAECGVQNPGCYLCCKLSWSNEQWTRFSMLCAFSWLHQGNDLIWIPQKICKNNFSITHRGRSSPLGLFGILNGTGWRGRDL